MSKIKEKRKRKNLWVIFIHNFPNQLLEKHLRFVVKISGNLQCFFCWHLLKLLNNNKKSKNFVRYVIRTSASLTSDKSSLGSDRDLRLRKTPFLSALEDRGPLFFSTYELINEQSKLHSFQPKKITKTKIK